MEVVEKIKDVLGAPYYANAGVLLYNQDCQDGLAKLVQAGVQVGTTITSPPYNIGKEYEEVRSVEDFVHWLVEVCDKLYDATLPHGNLLLNIGYLNVPGKGRAVPIAYLLWDKIRFFLNQEIVWNYGAGVASKNYLSPRNEKILWYVKDALNYTFNLDEIRDPDVKYPNQKKNGKLRCNTLGKNPSDVWQIAKVTSGANRSSEERMPHPAQFPVDLITRLVCGFTHAGDWVLDPFMGSGTTAEVCMKNQRHALGFEMREDYCETAAHRLQIVERSLRLKESELVLF